MPGSKLFKEDLDLPKSYNFIFKDKTKFEYDIEGTKEVEGKLFGGCLCVYELIGTPYLPH